METKESKLSKIKLGMIWYEDDSFSFERIANKRIKAVVELINDGFIYGDLTVSEIININENQLNWNDILHSIGFLSRDFKKIQSITWPDIDELSEVYNRYDVVRKTFDMLGKSSRKGIYWTKSLSSGELETGFLLDFASGKIREEYIEKCYDFRPVLKLKIVDDCYLKNNDLNAELCRILSSIFYTYQ